MTASPKHTRFRPVVRSSVVVTACLLLAGCFNPFFPPTLGRGISTPPPTPNSASGLLRLLEWAYTNRDYSVYKTLFTDDYRFGFATADTAGNAYRQSPWTREDELEYSRNLFEGGSATQPAATSITLVLDKSFTEFADPRPEKSRDFEHFRAIRTQVALNITDANGTQTNVSGKALFYLVRGDSAVIPPELGLSPDPNRWYINRWDDETYTPLGLAQAAQFSPSSAGSITALRSTPRLSPAHRLVLREVSNVEPHLPASPRSRGGSRPASQEDLFPQNASWGWVRVVWRN